MLRIGIDCRLAGAKHAGIGRYISNFVPRAIDLIQNKAHIVLFCSSQEQAQEISSSVHAEITVVLAPIKHYSFAEQTKFLLVLNKQRLDLLHTPHFNVPFFYRGKSVVTIHDLLWHTQRGLQVTTLNPAVYWLKYFFYTRIVAHAVTMAKRIFVPSKTIATELTTTFPFVKKKVLVTYEGVGDSLLQANISTRTRKKNTLLYVGSLYPHKNIDIVLQLLQRRPEIHLEIVTARTTFVNRVKKQIAAYEVQTQVKFFLAINDHALAQHYRHATALIQPSLSEGFGLTGLEALLQGTTVIASNIPIFHEIYQDHALFFQPKDITSLETAWESVAHSNSNVVLPNSFTKQYSWDALAKATTDAYFTAIND